ncbi:MAG: ABC transporter ATP-binding protein [Thermoplasmata archaeon]
MPCIEMENTIKTYGNKRALDGLSFSIECGESMALIGPNGAGKSTTLKILSGLLDPDGGKVSIMDNAPSSMEAKRLIGYLPEDATPYLTLTVRENLEYIGALRNVPDVKDKVDFLLDFMSLREYSMAKVSSLSRGNRQKLSLSLAIIHDPKILLLDEPLNYLDIPAQENVIKYFKNMNATFLVSTHIMSIAERFTTKVMIINHGRKIWEGNITELKEKSKEGEESIESVITKMMGGEGES